IRLRPGTGRQVPRRPARWRVRDPQLPATLGRRAGAPRRPAHRRAGRRRPRDRVMVVSACHCDRRGIGPHFHSLPDGCPVVPVLVKPPCAHGRVDEPCERCWAKGCAWYYAYGCICGEDDPAEDRKSTRLNSSHVKISYAVFCLKKKSTTEKR